MKGLSRILLVFPLLAVPCLFDLSAQALFEPEDGVVYHGVGWGDEAQTNYCAMFAGDKQPLLFQNIFAIPGGARLLTVARILEALDPPNMHHEKQFAELSVHFMLGDETAVDSAFTFTGQYDSYIDTLAQALIQNGRPVFLRIGLEMNGPWNGYSPWIFPKAFRKLVLGLRARNVKDIVYVWCYEPDAESDFADSTERGWKWFPGDDAVDWFGLDLFDADHFNPDLSDSTGSRLTKKGRSTAFLRFAAERGKPVYLNELSARHVYISADRNDPDFDDGKRDWDAWFDPFFRFLALNPIIKAFNYINLDWRTITKYADWGDSRIEINTYIRDRWTAKLAEPRFKHIGTELGSAYTYVGPGYTAGRLSGNSDRLSVFPNPVNQTTVIEYSLGEGGFVSLGVVNALGQRMSNLIEGNQDAGSHRIFWASSGMPSGLVFVVLRSSKGIRIEKLIVLK